MILISNSSYALVKYHVAKNNLENRAIKFLVTNSIKEITDILLECITYNSEGDLILSSYVIYYEGEKPLPPFLKQNKNNLTYIVFKSLDLFEATKSIEGIKVLKLSPLQYQHEISFVENILEPNAWPYFWSEYCVGKFKSNPLKWYNEVRYLMFLFAERGNKKFSIQDLDFIFNKITDKSKNYLFNMYTPFSKQYLLKLNNNELFLLFIKGEKYKSEVHKNLELNKPELLIVLMLFKSSFYKSRIRLQEGVILFDYVIKHFNELTLKQIYNLFNLY